MTTSFGATLVSEGQTRFRLWSPDAETVTVEIQDRDTIPLLKQADGWHERVVACGAGARYRYRVRPDLAVPDPASRAQAGDVHDASLVVDPQTHVWLCADWRGRPWHEAVIYELHVGALGGFAGVTEALPRLAALGVTAIELMPVAEFFGARNWGYDGVLPYAPDAAYGTPDDLRRLVDTAHTLGLMVLLDVVYNHFGPEGNYLGTYASGFYRKDRSTPGAMRSTSVRNRCAGFSSRTRCTGCRSTEWMGCASMQCTPSVILVSCRVWLPRSEPAWNQDGISI